MKLLENWRVATILNETFGEKTGTQSNWTKKQTKKIKHTKANNTKHKWLQQFISRNLSSWWLGTIFISKLFVVSPFSS